MSAPQALRARTASAPQLPRPRGELSRAVTAFLTSSGRRLPGGREVARADPLGEDAQLALHLAYELHYRGFAGVPDDMEWDPELLGLRGTLEQRFEQALRDRCGRYGGVDEAFEAVLADSADGSGVTRYLLGQGTPAHLREYAVLRSVYQLREADPHLWVVPRLSGRAKAAMMAVQFDEFGCGRAERMHARLYADLMRDLGLDASYGRYVDLVGPEALATVNVMSLFGLHRARRGALVGHFGVLEATSSPASSWMVAAMRRIGAGEAAIHFYDEHVEADAVHEQLVRREVVGGLLDDEPGLAGDVVFGIEATSILEDALADAVTTAWEVAETALRHPLPSLPDPAWASSTAGRGDVS